MSALTDALERMDVMDFKPQEVMIIRTALSKLQDELNPPQQKDDEALLVKAMELTDRFEKWWNTGTCDDCGADHHRHFLSCHVFKQLKEDER